MDAVGHCHWDRISDDPLRIILGFVSAETCIVTRAVSKRWLSVIDAAPHLWRDIPRSRVLEEFRSRLKRQYLTKSECGPSRLSRLSQFVTRFGVTAEEARAEEELHTACVSGRLNLARWLVSEFGASARGDAHDILFAVCFLGHLDVMQWLIPTFKSIPSDVSVSVSAAGAALFLSWPRQSDNGPAS
jgi:hypothetical protein